MTIYRFREIALTGKKRVKCINCGTMLTRQKKFYQTLNPFNKREDGLEKDAADIIPELEEAISEWRKQFEICAACKENRGCTQ